MCKKGPMTWKCHLGCHPGPLVSGKQSGQSSPLHHRGLAEGQQEGRGLAFWLEVYRVSLSRRLLFRGPDQVNSGNSIFIGNGEGDLTVWELFFHIFKVIK